MDRDNSPILDDSDKEILVFAEKLTFDHYSMSEDDLNKLRNVGFSDENILDIIASISYRNFSNRINISLGLDAAVLKGPQELMDVVEFARRANV
ncbi:MAG: hypothetical protein VX794_05155 [Nitrospinota bacterium]|nr:hypothetical protein [Nitrospinota bacterium]